MHHGNIKFPYIPISDNAYCQNNPMHYAICIMDAKSLRTNMVLPKSHALWQICIMTLCIMSKSTVLVRLGVSLSSVAFLSDLSPHRWPASCFACKICRLQWPSGGWVDGVIFLKQECLFCQPEQYHARFTRCIKILSQIKALLLVKSYRTLTILIVQGFPSALVL